MVSKSKWSQNNATLSLGFVVTEFLGMNMCVWIFSYGVATISRPPQNIGHFCKRAL